MPWCPSHKVHGRGRFATCASWKAKAKPASQKETLEDEEDPTRKDKEARSDTWLSSGLHFGL